MKFYFAPLEGITGYIYRRAYQECFDHIDKYFAPFIVPNQSSRLGPKEERDILPKHNEGMYLVPQIMTNRAEDFLTTAEKIRAFGYEEVNLNLGCPSKTVVTKKRGSGFLAFPDELECFLDEIYAKSNMKISIKTRIGKESPEEFERLLKIYNQYPVEELIIHPRLQTDYYKNKPDLEVFGEALENSRNPVCYNGDINSEEDYRRLAEHFPGVSCIMLGRGILRNPGLVLELKEGTRPDKQQIRNYHDRIYREYKDVLYGEKNVLFKMKELWAFMAEIFTDHEKYAKKIRKAQRLAVYEEAVNALFEEQNINIQHSYQESL